MHLVTLTGGVHPSEVHQATFSHSHWHTLPTGLQFCVCCHLPAVLRPCSWGLFRWEEDWKGDHRSSLLCQVPFAVQTHLLSPSALCSASVVAASPNCKARMKRNFPKSHGGSLTSGACSICASCFGKSVPAIRSEVVVFFPGRAAL